MNYFDSTIYVYFPAKVTDGLELADWFTENLPVREDQLDLSDKFDGGDKTLDHFNFSVKVGAKKVNFMTMINLGQVFESDDRELIRVRVNGSDPVVTKMFEELVEKLDGWVGQTSKAFDRPATEDVEYFFNYHHSDVTLIEPEAFVEAIVKAGEHTRLEVEESWHEARCAKYTKITGLDATFHDGNYVVGLKAED